MIPAKKSKWNAKRHGAFILSKLPVSKLRQRNIDDCKSVDRIVAQFIVEFPQSTAPLCDNKRVRGVWSVRDKEQHIASLANLELCKAESDR